MFNGANLYKKNERLNKKGYGGLLSYSTKLINDAKVYVPFYVRYTKTSSVGFYKPRNPHLGSKFED